MDKFDVELGGEQVVIALYDMARIQTDMMNESFCPVKLFEDVENTFELSAQWIENVTEMLLVNVENHLPWDVVQTNVTSTIDTMFINNHDTSCLP
jgi:hypothetical protein